LKRILILSAVLMVACVSLISCSYTAPGTAGKPSGLKFRAFISDPLSPNGTANVPLLHIVDATQDKLSTFAVSLSGVVADPQFMLLTADGSGTLVVSNSDTSLIRINNSTEAPFIPSGATSAAPPVRLPDVTESVVMSPTGTPPGNTVYAAIPNATVLGHAPGVVVVANLSQGSITATIPVPGARFLLESPDGNHILVFSDNSDSVTDISTSLIGSSTDPRSAPITGFSRPVGGIFTSNTTALIFDCGPECGGSVPAGVSTFTLGNSIPTATVPVPAATEGLISGSTLYVAGTKPGTLCASGTLAQTCGTVSLVNISSMTAAGSFEITDGYHNRIALGSNGQLFIGAHNCTNITTQNNQGTGEIRGCLSIFNTQNSSAKIPPANGDVTGIQSITGRNLVYVTQNGSFIIYDTTTVTLATTQVRVVGNMTDVLLVDGP
jgi:hypothetical protein